MRLTQHRPSLGIVAVAATVGTDLATPPHIIPVVLLQVFALAGGGAKMHGIRLAGTMKYTRPLLEKWDEERELAARLRRQEGEESLTLVGGSEPTRASDRL